MHEPTTDLEPAVTDRSTERDAREQRVVRARAALDAEVTALQRERARRLAPLQAELAEAMRAAGHDAPHPRGALVHRGQSRVWSLVAQRIGTATVSPSDLVEIAYALGYTDVDARTAGAKLARWLRAGYVERVARGRYRFSAAGIAHLRIGREEETPPVPSTAVRTPLTIAAATVRRARRRAPSRS